MEITVTTSVNEVSRAHNVVHNASHEPHEMQVAEDNISGTLELAKSNGRNYLVYLLSSKPCSILYCSSVGPNA
jgi:hypothetical protein